MKFNAARTLPTELRGLSFCGFFFVPLGFNSSIYPLRRRRRFVGGGETGVLQHMSSGWYLPTYVFSWHRARVVHFSFISSILVILNPAYRCSMRF
ncbi:hypothetical protein V8F06_003974 [Rhypophila decipiens]